MRRIVLGGLAAIGIALTSGSAAAQTAGGAFGGAGQLALQTDLDLHFEGTSTSDHGGSTTDILIQPAADYFVINDLSVGGAITLDFHTFSPDMGNGTTLTTFGIKPRVGYNIAIIDKLSFWPDLFVQYSTTGVSNNGGSESAFAIGAFAPLLFHPVEHFFVGLGPNFSTELSHNHSPPMGPSVDNGHVTSFGVMLTLGGWLQL